MYIYKGRWLKMQRTRSFLALALGEFEFRTAVQSDALGCRFSDLVVLCESPVPGPCQYRPDISWHYQRWPQRHITHGHLSSPD